MNNNNEKENKKKGKTKLNSDEEKNKNKIKEKSSNYKCILHSPLKTNDCINSIDIFNNYIAYGTIMGEVILCRLEEEIITINNANTNINNKCLNEYNQTDVQVSINKDIIEKEGNIKEIILNINNNKDDKLNKDNLLKENKENKTRNEKKPECIKVFMGGRERQSTDIYPKINQENNNIVFPRIQILFQEAVENICCLSLFDDILDFSIGDKELIHCEKISLYNGNNLDTAYNYKQNYIYDSEHTHSDFCENCSCLMSRNNFLIVYSFYFDFNWPLKFNKIKYDNRNLRTFDLVSGYIEMSNYNVPFDFDDDKFLYVEYFDDSVRSINIYKTLSNNKIFSILINKQFGHISHMKLLPDDCIFLCRNLCVCEIYKYKNNNNSYNQDNYINVKFNEKTNNDFILLNMWVHKENTEIISSNVYISGNNISYDYNNNKIKVNYMKKEIYKNSHNKKEKQIYLNYKKDIHNLINDNANNSSIDSSSSKNKILDKFNKHNEDYLNIVNNPKNNNKFENNEEKTKKKIIKTNCLLVNYNYSDNNLISSKEDYYIITLDIEGNFNIYSNNDNCKEKKITLFNLYKIDNIELKYKKLKFFSIGFPYFITMNEYYYVITTDYGVFAISKSNDI